MTIISTDMKNLAVANGLALAPYASQTLPGGKSTLERVGEYGRSLPATDRLVLLLPAGAQAPLGFEALRLESRSMAELLGQLEKLAAGYDNIFYFFADCPLLDPALAERMLQNHQRYFADYTFADGFPLGIAPEILKPSVLPPLRKLAEGMGTEAPSAHERGSLFEVIKKDINNFDIETELAPADLRLLRLALCADSKRNLLLARRILEAGASDAESVCTLVQQRPELLRTLPSFFSIQIVEGCPQLCSYCPYPRFGISQAGKRSEMEPERFEALASQIASFCEEAVISISLWGEPAYHSRFAELATSCRAHGLRLVVETSGIGWDPEHLAEIERRGGNAIDWILSLDAETPELYRRLRGEGYEQALSCVEDLNGRFPGHVYIQAVRMKDNEERLEEFYRHWKGRTGKVIIQKYDSFCGLLPDRKVTDLSPLKRFPCWHLKRDLSVLIDGRVPLCREDVSGRHLLGNLFQEGLEAVWERGERYYRDHLRQEYPELCAACDEYYTYNF